MRKIILMVACLLCIALLLPACSGGESGSASTVLSGGQTPGANNSQGQQAGSSQSQGGQEQKMIKPEQLISKDEAATLLGETVKDAAKGEYPMLGLNTCFYAAEKPDSKGYLHVGIIQMGQQGQSGGSGGGGQSGQSSQPSSSESSQASQSSGGGSSGGGEEMSAKTLYEGFKKLFSDPNSVLTGRIGEDAFVSAPGISILSGQYYIYVAVGNADPLKAQTMVKQAAELAMNNLKRIQGE